MGAGVGTETVAGDREDAVLQRSGEHRLLAVGQDQVRRVRDHVRAGDREGAGGLGEDPVEADHHAHTRGAHAVHGQLQVAGVEPLLLVIEKMELAVGSAYTA